MTAGTVRAGCGAGLRWEAREEILKEEREAARQRLRRLLGHKRVRAENECKGHGKEETARGGLAEGRGQCCLCSTG